MIIDSLQIENFRDIDTFALEPGAGATLLIGPNGTGKSSVIEAIRLALYGWNAWTDRRGGGAMTLVRDGAKQSTVNLMLSHRDRSFGVSLTIYAHGKQAMKWECVDGDGVNVENREALWSAIGVPREKAEAISYIEDALETGAFGNLLSAALCDSLPLSRVLDHCGEHGEWFAAFAKKYALRDTPNASDHEALGVKAYELRTSRKRELKERAPELADTFVTAPVFPDGTRVSETDIPRMQRRADELAKAREALIEERGRCSLGLRSAATIAKELDAATIRHDKAYNAHRDALAESERLCAALENARENVRALTNKESSTRGEITRLEMTVNVFKDGVCPKCQTKLPKAKLVELTGDTEAHLAKLRVEHASLNDEIETSKRERDDTETVYRDAATKAVKLQEAANAESAVVTRLQNEAAAPVRDTAAVNADIEAVDAETEQVNGFISAWQAYKGREDLAAFLASLETDIAHLDWCVESFKDGVLLKSLAATDKRRRFVDALNVELAAFGYACELQQDKKRLDLLLGRLGGVRRPFLQCSRGEQCLAEIACALVYGGGRAPVLIDNVERLYTPHDETLRKRLQTIDSTVILAGAMGRVRKEALDKVRGAWGNTQIVWMERRDDGAKAVANG